MIINKKTTIRLERSDIEALAPKCAAPDYKVDPILALLRREISGAGDWDIMDASSITFGAESLQLLDWMEIEMPEITEKQIDAVWILIGRKSKKLTATP